MDGKIVGKNGEVQLYDPSKMDLNFVRANMGLPHLNDHQVTLGESHIFEDINQLSEWRRAESPQPARGARQARHRDNRRGL